MHEDDDYNDEHDYDDAKEQYKHYFKFDPEAWDVWGKFLYDALNDIVEKSPNVWYVNFNPKSFPVKGYVPSTGKDKTFQYLGNNSDGAAIWKKKYFIHDSLHQKYIDHLKANAEHFLKEPQQYRGLYDILN